MKPIDVYRELITKTYSEDRCSIEYRLNRCFENDEPIPDHLLPGRTLKSLTEEQRELLKDLKSEDVSNERLY